MLRASLARQGHPHQLIALDNRAGRFPSAAAALNEGIRQASGDPLFFAHQDVCFEAGDWLDRAAAYLQSLPDVGIAGVAGARALQHGHGREIVSNIEDSSPPQRTGHVSLERPEVVDTVDECAFLVPGDVCRRIAFDETTCDGWHLYAVDYSLMVRRAGLVAYALPLPLYHQSGGAVVRVIGVETYERAYFRTLRRVLAKHAGAFDRLHTTCGSWSTQQSLIAQRFPPALVRRAVRHWVTSVWRGRQA
jgi:hypothetical protein